MSDVVNLRRVRKQRARAEKRAGGAVRAAEAGETKAARERRDADMARAERILDGHKIAPPEDA